MAFRNSKTRRHSEIKKTRPSMKQDFSEEALSKENTEASLASLSYSSRAPTEWSAIFAFGVWFSRNEIYITPMSDSSLWLLSKALDLREKIVLKSAPTLHLIYYACLKLYFLFASAVFRCLSNDIALKGFPLQHCAVFFYYFALR